MSTHGSDPSARSNLHRRAHRGSAPTSGRGLSPVVGTVLLVAITVILAGTVAFALGGISTPATPMLGTETPNLALEADAEADELRFEHEAGPPIDVDGVDLAVEIADEELSHQPPIPFVGAPGYRTAPDGPFNAAGDQRWESGETATLTLASTNEPGLEEGDVVRVEVTESGELIADLVAVAC